jgi:hypothetical protein
MWRNRNNNREEQQMSATKEIDLGAITEEHLAIVQSVYKLMAFLLDENADYSKLSTEELQLIHVATTNIKIRDGVLKYFSDAPFNIRVDIMKSFTTISQAMVDNELMEAEAIGYSSMILAAFMLCHAGMAEEADEEDNIEYELKLVDDLLHEAETLGCTASLLGLLKMARDHNIPPRIFYSSLQAVTFHYATDPVGHLNG